MHVGFELSVIVWIKAKKIEGIGILLFDNFKWEIKCCKYTTIVVVLEGRLIRDEDENEVTVD